MANTQIIIGFYDGTEPDHRGRYLHEIQQWTDDQLEVVHDYIQWLFSLPEPSGSNLAAPESPCHSIRGSQVQPCADWHQVALEDGEPKRVALLEERRKLVVVEHGRLKLRELRVLHSHRTLPFRQTEDGADELFG